MRATTATVRAAPAAKLDALIQATDASDELRRIEEQRERELYDMDENGDKRSGEHDERPAHRLRRM